MGLPWIRFDTNMPMHDKVITLAGYGDKGLAAAFVYVASLAYAGANATDGYIPRGALPFVHGKPAHVRLLLEVRLWEQADKGWRIRNYGDRNVVGTVQQVISEGLSEAGKKGAAARWGIGKANGQATAEANGHPTGRTPVATPMADPMRSDGTYVTERTNDLPRLKSISSSPERARGNRDQARREIEELTNHRSGGAA
jgi:hypothetical protein